MMYFAILLAFFLSIFPFFDAFAYSNPDDGYLKFELDGFYIYADNKHITNISLDWNGESLPSGTITFDGKVDSVISVMIPKNIPRTMNLDFGSSMAVFYSDTLVVPIKENDVDCFYNLRIPVNGADEIAIDSISVAAGRWEPVTVNDPKCDDMYLNYSDTYKAKPSRPQQSHSMFSPLKQFQSGLSLKEIKCKDSLVLLQKYDGSPACVKQETKQKLIEREWTIDSQTSFEILGSESETSTCPINSKEIIPGPYPLQSCPVMSHRITGTMLNNTGFSSISDSNLVAHTDNFVLKPGNNGTMTFLYELEYPDVPSNFRISPPQIVNMTNYLQFIHYKTLDIKDLENYPDTILKKDYNSFSTCFESPDGNSCVGEITDDYHVNAFVYDHPGIDVSFDKPLEVISASEPTVSTITISVDRDALQGTYFVKLPNGVCSGGFILLTISDCG